MVIDEKKIKHRHYDCLTGKFTYDYYTNVELQEIAKKEEEEAKKPKSLNTNEKIELLERENADLLFDSAMKDYQLNCLEKDLADLTFEIAIGGM